MAPEVEPDLFDAVLNLEEDYYAIGHQEGIEAGRVAGRLEGRAFGIEKGFEKYLSLGLIKGRTRIWEARISDSSSAPTSSNLVISNPRHTKHVSLLQTLTSNPPIRNEEDDVEEVDDRIRRGKAKVKILENALGEAADDGDPTLGGRAVNLETEVEGFRSVGRSIARAKEAAAEF
ncbi:hypothetical protein ABW19_dt0207658 [Dactylella cylindrospora]|nr:hypothetical protein ABW19_dt0207658 [Dactylella cylindrospora]